MFVIPQEYVLDPRVAHAVGTRYVRGIIVVTAMSGILTALFNIFLPSAALTDIVTIIGIVVTLSLVADHGVTEYRIRRGGFGKRGYEAEQVRKFAAELKVRKMYVRA